jgi:orotate phosphoribosyltransferase
MIINKHIARQTAKALLQVNAIKLQPKEPFTWASGWKTPIYCIREEMAKFLESHYGKPDVIAGVATGAIGIGMLVAEYLGVPFIYVRPEAKSHGRQNQIEGYVESGQNVVVIEDLISTGKSSLNAVKALKEANLTVKGMIAIFSYGFKISEENFEKEHLTLHTLSNYDHLLQEAAATNYISENEIETLSKWNANPSDWNVN